MEKSITRLGVLTGLGVLALSLPAFAATPINLSLQPASFLMSKTLMLSGMQVTEHSRSTDFNNTLHIRMAETYQGHAVWGSDAVVHVPQAGNTKKAMLAVLNKETTMNGIVYSNLNQDLDKTPAYVFSEAQLKKVTEHVISLYQHKTKKNSVIQEKEATLIVYLDEQDKAHWAYKISFLVPSTSHALPERPTYIIDAAYLTVYQNWDDIKTLDTVNAGGFGGNHKTGQKIFDSIKQKDHAKYLIMQRDASKNLCIMQNEHVIIKDERKNNKVMTFACQGTDPEHNDIYWNGNHDMIETTWSPSNDAMFGAEVTRNMFTDWYHMPMLVKNGKPMLLPMIVHDPVENAYWDGSKVLFGDSVGSSMFNPFTQLDTVGHEICHGFTEQHSRLAYYGQSGGLNEAFSDMAGIASEYYAFGETKFLVGWGDVKAEGKALRYMEQPSKDCEGGTPGNDCSIDNMGQYKSGIDVHYSSGIFNRVYYLLATTPDWDARKAFDVMVQANISYWTSTSTFAESACGVIKAARDYKYDVNAVANAFQTVGINTKACIK